MRIAITGIGSYSSIGTTANELFANLLAEKSGLTYKSPIEDIGLLAACTGILESVNVSNIPAHLVKGLDKTSLLSLNAAQEALTQAGLSEECLKTTQLFWGCSFGGLETLNQGYIDLWKNSKKRVRPTTIPYTMPSAPAFHVANLLKVKGPSVTISAACASSAIAIIQACKAIHYGECNVSLAGGVDAMAVDVCLRAWQMAAAVCQVDPAAPEKSCKPFDKNRTGFALADGAACLLLENEEHAIARGAKILGYITGFGHTCDAEHISKPNGASQVQAMENALNMAKKSAEDIGYINTHGTATVLGDQIEAESIFKLFGNTPCVGSTKAQHGHLIGAAGAIESVICVNTLISQTIPGNPFLSEVDPTLPPINLPIHAQHKNVNAVLSNSFAFGGVNVSVLFEANPIKQER